MGGVRLSPLGRPALFASSTGWIAAFYGALYVYARADFKETGTFWVFGWPFVLLLVLATAINLLLAGGVEGLCGSPLPGIARLNRLLRSARERELASSADLADALVRLPGWPLFNAGCAMALAALVMIAVALIERVAAGSARNTMPTLVAGGVATLLFGNTSFAVADVLLSPHTQRLRLAAVQHGLDPYRGGTVPTSMRLLSSALPMVLAFVVAARLATDLRDSWFAQLSIVVLGAGLSVALAALQSLALRDAARDLGRAAARLAGEETVQLITGSTDPHIVGMARAFNEAAARVDDSMRRSAVRYEALFEGAGDAILLVDPHSRHVLHANRRAQALTGRSADSLRRVAFEELFRERHAGDAPSQDERRSFEVLRADGSVCPVDVALSFVAVGDDVILQAILHDVSKREQIEAELRDSVRRMEQLHYLAVKLGGTVEQIADYVAATLAELLDVPVVSVGRFEGDEFVALVMRDQGAIVHDSRMSLLGTPCERTRHQASPYVAYDVCRMFSDNAFLVERHIQTYVGVPIVVASGETRGCVAVMDQRRRNLSDKDMNLLSVFAQRLAQAFDEQEFAEARDALVRRLTEQNAELRRAKESLTEADRLKSEFMGMMSHELRTPLNVFAGYSEMLLDMARENPQMPLSEQTGVIGRMIQATAVLANLVEDTLSVLRLESAGVRVYEEPVSLGRLFDEICASDRFLGGGGAVAEHWEAADDLPPILSDRLKLRQIITNLVGNARKFTEKGSITINAQAAAEGGVTLVVEDTGCGIPAGDLPYVFDLYRQAGNGESRDGCGIGLYIVRRYCELLGGSIEVESTVGRGTRFTVRLPLRNRAASPREVLAEAS